MTMKEFTKDLFFGSGNPSSIGISTLRPPDQPQPHHAKKITRDLIFVGMIVRQQESIQLRPPISVAFS